MSKITTAALFCLIHLFCQAQSDTGLWDEPRLNTAAKENYMLPSEREMLYEINRVRSNPKRYVQYLLPYLEDAKKDLETHGLGTKSYSIVTHYQTKEGLPEETRQDTIWHDRYQEEVDAINSLIEYLQNAEPMPILIPDRGIYQAATKHARDEAAHGWELGHLGSDKSWPRDRVLKFSPQMKDGSENLAGSGKGAEENVVTPREVVILLLIDSGISNYGHRYNLLNPNWDHGACKYGGFYDGMHRWVQNFGSKRAD